MIENYDNFLCIISAILSEHHAPMHINSLKGKIY